MIFRQEKAIARHEKAHREFVKLLRKNAGKVVSYHALAKLLWPDSKSMPKTWYGMVTMEVHNIKRNAPHLKDKIVNVHGKGYLFVPKLKVVQ